MDAMDVQDPTSTSPAPVVADPVAKAVARTARWAINVIEMGWTIIVLGVIGGIIMMAQEKDTGSYSSETTHPMFGAGIGVAFGSIVWGVLIIFLGVWGRAWAMSERNR